jgi:hypothetical protein
VTRPTVRPETKSPMLTFLTNAEIYACEQQYRCSNSNIPPSELRLEIDSTVFRLAMHPGDDRALGAGAAFSKLYRPECPREPTNSGHGIESGFEESYRWRNPATGPVEIARSGETGGIRGSGASASRCRLQPGPLSCSRRARSGGCCPGSLSARPALLRWLSRRRQSQLASHDRA